MTAATATNLTGFLKGNGANVSAAAAVALGTEVTGILPSTSHPALTGDVTTPSGSVATTVARINGVALSGLATGILKNTTGTGAPSIAVAADFPTLNQSTTGNAATATTITGMTSGTTSHSAIITVPIATRTKTFTNNISSGSCSGSGTGVQPGCLFDLNVTAMGSVTTTIAGFTGCTAAATQKLIVTPQNLPASVWLQNAVCNGVGTAAITLITAKTNASISVPTSTVFQFILLP